MRALVPSGRLGPSPGHSRPLAPPFFPEQLIGLGFWEACDAQSTVTGSAVQQAGGSFGAATAIVLDADHNAGAFNHAKADVLGVAGATKVSSAGDQEKLVSFAGAKWACEA